MQLGITMFPTDLAIDPVRLGTEVEARGFESLWFPEHTHIPTSRRTPFPGGEPIPEEYKRTYDPFVALGAVAAATERIRLATGICLVAQRDPIICAKEVASVDRLSGGRFVFGIGYGWNVDEMEHHGVDPRRRRALVREKMLAMEALWSQDVASFEGELVRFGPSWSWPKPLQQPRPPVLIGGAAGPTLFRHIVEFADGWMPIGGRGLREHLPVLREAFAEAGRDPESLRITVFGAQPDPDKLAYYAELGCERVVLWVPPAPEATVLEVLDRYAPLLEQLPTTG